MQLMWRLRSPFSGQTSECHLVDTELHFVQIPPSLTLIAPSRYIDTVAATKSAALLATALRGDGFTIDVV